MDPETIGETGSTAGEIRPSRRRPPCRPAVLAGIVGIGLLGVSVAFAHSSKGSRDHAKGAAGKEERPRKESESLPLYARHPDAAVAPRPIGQDQGEAGPVALPGEAPGIARPSRIDGVPAAPLHEARPPSVLPDPARGPPPAA